MVQATLERTREALADEWRRSSPGTPDAIAAFYRESECMGADLDAWHATPERQEWTRAIVEVAGANRVQSVLDVGAGGGHDLRALRKEFGHDVYLAAVEPNSTLRLDLPAQEDWPSIDRVTGDYDMVICVDVLEHVPDPEALLLQIIDRVKMGGLLIEASATHDQETPLHLPELVGWEAAGTLRRCGFEPREQVERLTVWQRVGVVDTDLATVLLCAHREIAVPTVECLFGLIDFGWPIAMVYGDALIDRARAKAVSAWYRKNETDVFLMIDDDIVFKPSDAARVVNLAREKRSIACGAYPVGGGEHMASRAWPGATLEFGEGKSPLEIRWAATGFMAVHRDVITEMIKGMALCYPGKPDAFWPLFTPFALATRPGYEDAADYLSEDYAFCQRALELGFTSWLDQSVILVHLKVKALTVWNMPGATVRERE